VWALKKDDDNIKKFFLSYSICNDLLSLDNLTEFGIIIFNQKQVRVPLF